MKGAVLEAVKYGQQHVLPLVDGSPAAFARAKQGMAMLAFGSSTDGPVFQEFLCAGRWAALKEAFKDTFLKLYGMSSIPPLNLSVEIGLATMKTPACQHGTENTECPVCSAVGAQLAASLPLAHFSHSALVCWESKKLMDGDNYPLVLPNGNVYSRHAIESLAQAHAGKVVCPRTQEEFTLDLVKRAYIL